MLTSDSKKKMKAIKDFINSNELMRGRQAIEEQIRKEKALSEDNEFEQRNRKRK